MPLLLLLAAAAAAAATPGAAPDATELFDRDPLLGSWARASFDTNHDGWLTLFEARAALGELKRIADTDGDGRVTVQEYDAARRFLAARLNLASTPAR